MWVTNAIEKYIYETTKKAPTEYSVVVIVYASIRVLISYSKDTY